MEVFGQGVIDSGSKFEWWVFPGLGHGLSSQKESYLTPKLMHIYYSYYNFLAKKGCVAEPPKRPSSGNQVDGGTLARSGE